MAEKSEQKPKKKGGPGRPIQPGQVLNPGGRPGGYAAFRASFRKDDDLTVIQRRLREVMESGSGAESTNAARLWLEYGWGKPQSSPEDLDAAASPFAGLTTEQLLELARNK